MIIAFWACVALLLGGAMLFVLPPLLRPAGPLRTGISPMAAYRDQRTQIDAELAQGTLTPAQHAAALEELQARVLEEVGPGEDLPVAQTQRSTRLVVALALAIPAGALAIYGVIGTPAALRPAEEQQQAAGKDGAHAMSQEQIEAMVEQLAEKLKKNPNDGNGWHMLARSYVAFQRLPEAAEAYDKASKLLPNDPNVLSDYADVLAMVNGRSLEGRPEQLVKQALAADPNHPKALALAGTAAFNRGDFAGAASSWKKLLATLPPGSEQARAVQSNIDQAEANGGPIAPKVAAAPAAPSAAPPANPGAGDATAAAGASVEGTVTVSDAVKGSIPQGATLFVYARPTDGGRMPLAILRVPAGAFPVQFKLDDSLAMAPQARISLQSQVQLVARISKSGNAAPQPGDLTGTLSPVKVGARDQKLVISEVVK